jgi:small subunit ribosomal protein S6
VENRHYEIIILVHPNQSDTVPEMTERMVAGIKEKKGIIHRQENWGRIPLQYPIARVHKAHYILMNIECEPSVYADFVSNFRYNDAILRHLVIKRKTALTETTYLGAKESDLEFKNVREVEYHNITLLKKHVMDAGRIIPSRITNASALKQRKITNAVKRARFLSLLPYCDRHRV